MLEHTATRIVPTLRNLALAIREYSRIAQIDSLSSLARELDTIAADLARDLAAIEAERQNDAAAVQRAIRHRSREP